MIIRLFLRCACFLIVSSFGILHGYAQDSVKRAPVKSTVKKPAALPVIIKPTVPTAVKPGINTPLNTPPDTAALRNKTLNQQYQYVLGKFYRYQQPIITALWKNYRDTLSYSRAQIKAAQAALLASAKTVDSLKADNAKRIQDISESKDSIDLLGIGLSKTTYNITMVALVIGLALALLIVIISTAKFRSDAKYRTTLYDELDEEFKAYKTKANEKEKKLARELQTERNKLDELLGR